MNKQELNRKLAEWAGFYCHDGMGMSDIDAEVYQVILYDPNGKQAAEPNFTQSLDACFKWLVPKLDSTRVLTNDAPSGDRFYNAEVKLGGRRTANTSGTPALALCLAIEKLIVRGAK